MQSSNATNIKALNAVPKEAGESKYTWKSHACQQISRSVQFLLQL